MLSFNREDSRWYLITSEITGRMKAIPVISDDFGFVPNMWSRWAIPDRRALTEKQQVPRLAAARLARRVGKKRRPLARDDKL